jgi:hypothetical protein
MVNEFDIFEIIFETFAKFFKILLNILWSLWR